MARTAEITQPVSPPAKAQKAAPVAFSRARSLALSSSVQDQETNVGLDTQLFYSILPALKTSFSDPRVRIQKVSGRPCRDIWETISRGWIETPIEPATDVESNFWHVHNVERRKAVRESLARTHQPAGRQEAFTHCGSGCFVQYSKSSNRTRLTANFCHDRFCERCSRSRSRVIGNNLARKLEGKSFIHAVLTLKHRAMPLAEQITRLIRCFRYLRDSKLWKENVKGGVYFIEIKRGEKDGLWHPHLHVAMQSVYIPHTALSNAWLSITGDSDIVHLKRYEDQEHVVRYVSKYAAKGMDSNVFKDESALDECITAMKGRRLWSCFGTWRKFDLDSTEENPGDWKTVCSLDELVASANRGEVWATTLFKSLRAREVHDDTTDDSS